MKSKMVRQADLTDECWMVQAFGTSTCKSCEYRDTAECGGQQIRKTGKNEKGLDVGPKGL